MSLLPVLLLSVGLILGIWFHHKQVKEPVTVNPVVYYFQSLMQQSTSIQFREVPLHTVKMNSQQEWIMASQNNMVDLSPQSKWRMFNLRPSGEFYTC